MRQVHKRKGLIAKKYEPDSQLGQNHKGIGSIAKR